MTIDRQAAPRPTGLSLTTQSVSRLAVMGWLTVFTLFEWMRFKFAIIGSGGFASLPYAISALECVELVLLARMIDLRAPSPQIGGGEGALILVGAAFLTLFATTRPIFSAGLLSLFVLARFGRDPAYRVFAIGVFVFIAQYLLLGGPFLWVHDAVANADAWITRHLLNLAGFGVTGSGPFILRPGVNFGVDIVWGCTSSYVAAMVAPGFIIVVLALRRAWRQFDFAWLAGLLLVTYAMNIVRLLLTSVSPEGHRFWHDGDGAAVFAITYMLLVVGFGFWATRQSRRPQIAR